MANKSTAIEAPSTFEARSGLCSLGGPGSLSCGWLLHCEVQWEVEARQVVAVLESGEIRTSIPFNDGSSRLLVSQ